jgi:hypothetical protein
MTADGRYAKLLSPIVRFIQQRFIQQRRLVPRKYHVWQTDFVCHKNEEVAR